MLFAILTIKTSNVKIVIILRKTTVLMTHRNFYLPQLFPGRGRMKTFFPDIFYTS